MIHWAFDTESGLYQGRLANRVITYAPVGIRNFSDVRLVYAEPTESVYTKWWNALKNSENSNIFVFHVWNLDWEIKPIEHWLYSYYVSKGYPLAEFPTIYRAVLTDFGYYEFEFALEGIRIKFVDDNNHLHAPLKDAISSIVKEEKFSSIFEINDLYGKESDKVSDLHEIWYKSPDEEIYLHYAKVDAFGTALVTESLFNAGRFSNYRCYGRKKFESFSPSLSASGAGFKDARARILYGCPFEEYAGRMQAKILLSAEKSISTKKFSSDSARENALQSAIRYQEKRFLEDYPREEWNKKFGLLMPDEQLMLEHNLRGGFVWGERGHFKGTFWHLDYKSSYPYEYVYGRLPVATDYFEYPVTDKEGKIKTDKDGKPITKKRPLALKRCDREDFISKSQSEEYIGYLEVEFAFVIRPNALPLLTLKECVCESVGLNRSKKPRTGQTKKLFMTYDEWCLVNRLYKLTNISVSGYWYSRARVGAYESAIREYFDGKEHSVGVMRALHKLDLNGATHGRPLLRRFTSHDLTLEIGEEIITHKNTAELTLDELDTCPLQGFVAMSNARVRLINQCMDLIDKGFRIYMCDTDSLITDCPPDTADEIWMENGRANRIIRTKSKEMSSILGMLEIEDGEPFDELLVWGLKRYLEKNNGSYRKSAFAGMQKRLQKEILMRHDIDEAIEWEQLTKKWVDDCYALRNLHKTVEPEDVWV